MATKKQEAAIQLYADLMAEVKVRINSIPTVANNPNGLPKPLIREFCFLQLRMLCELVALSCLTAHGDIRATQSKTARKAYSAEKIIQLLDDLHPDFFPQPVKVTTPEPNFHHMEPANGDFLTKAELLRLYARCGDILHRGSIKKLLSEKKPIQTSFSDINEYAKKVTALLRIHQVALLGGEISIVCILHNKVQGGNVQVAIAEAIGKSSP
jgi:hypothetical protein